MYETRKRITFVSKSNCDLSLIEGVEYRLFCYCQKEEWYIYHCSYPDKLASAARHLKEVQQALSS